MTESLTSSVFERLDEHLTKPGKSGAILIIFALIFWLILIVVNTFTPEELNGTFSKLDFRVNGTCQMISESESKCPVQGFALENAATNLRLFALNLETKNSGYGTKISASGRFIQSKASDYQALFRIDTIYAVTPAEGLDTVVASLRNKLPSLLKSVNSEGSKLLPGLVLGDDSAVSDKLRMEMISTSLSHLTAVSGANCSVIVVLLQLLFSRLGRVISNILAMIGLAGFVVLVGAEPSVQRASAMAVIVLIGLSAGRRVKALSALAFACICLFTLEPWLATSVGFALSTSATASLIVLQPKISQWLAPHIGEKLSLFISVPIAAQIGAQPILLLLDDGISLVAIPANLLAAPLAPVATVLGLITLAFSYLSIPIATLLVMVAWLPSEIIAQISEFFALLRDQYSILTVPLSGGIFTAIFLGLVITSFAVASSLLKPLRLLSIFALLFTLFLAIAGDLRIGFAGRGDWIVAQCDVGQGDAVVVRSRGETLLYDTGPDVDKLRQCLQSLGIERINILAISHFDEDHVGGLQAVFGIVDTVISGPIGDGDLSTLKQLTETGAIHKKLVFGEKVFLGDFEIRMLFPRTNAGNGDNDSSLVLQFGGPVEMLFLGDLGKSAQNELLNYANLSGIDVLKVAHHGSKDFSEVLNQRMAPKIALIGVGLGNSYGHPAQELLDSLKNDAKSWIIRSDLNGLSLIYFQELTLRVWSAR